MNKKRAIWLITVTVLILVVSLILLLHNPSKIMTDEAKIEQLSSSQVILVDGEAEYYAVQRGDIFSYFIDVLYNTDMVSNIDKKNLKDGINLQPFDVKGFTETDVKLNSNHRLYRITYTLQLINGSVDQIYKFPSIVVRYKLVNNEGYLEIPGKAKSVYVSHRLPNEIEDIIVINSPDVDTSYGMLKPVIGKISSTNSNYISWIFIASGSVLIIGALADFVLLAVPKMKREKEQEKLTENKKISSFYNTLCKNKKNNNRPEFLINQADHILRLVLKEKEHIDWLEELNFDSLPSEIIKEVILIFNNSQKELIDGQEKKALDESLLSLDKILRFYYFEDVDNWTC